MVLFAVLVGTSLNPYCALQSDRCSNHGTCYGAGQCHCQPGYGPEVSYINEALCSRPNMPCTGGQLARALKLPLQQEIEAAQICCSHHGVLTDAGCSCDLGYGPTTPNNELTPTVPLCGIECYDPTTQTHSTCSGHGSCSNATNFVCKCDQGFTGKQCGHTVPQLQWVHTSPGENCNEACANHEHGCRGVPGPETSGALQAIMNEAGWKLGKNGFMGLGGGGSNIFSSLAPACNVPILGDHCIYVTDPYTVACTTSASGVTRLCPCVWGAK